MPRKTWASLERVTAGDVNTFLVDQSVMTFATVAARDTALPTPTTGMQSAVQASPDLGAPRYWDGSAWTLIRSGFTYPNVLTLGPTATDFGTATITQLFNAGTWYQLVASMATDSVVIGIQFVGTNAGPEDAYELGVGSAGSEIVRSSSFIASNDRPFTLLPYGVYVAAGQRLAIRAPNVTGSFSAQVAVHWITSASVSAAQAGRVILSDTWDTTWKEVATTPPLAGGVWVTGFRLFTTSSNQYRFALGAAGSEVAATVNAYNRSTADTHIPPFFWPSGTRLAMQATAGMSSTSLNVAWRESLS